MKKRVKRWLELFFVSIGLWVYELNSDEVWTDEDRSNVSELLIRYRELKRGTT